MSDLAQFNGTIGPGNLLSLVRNTAPFLFDPAFDFPQTQERSVPPRLIALAGHPYGWLDILRHAERSLPPTSSPSMEQREDYFALCMACHHATVATFIPTDVDSKIRGVLWQGRMDPDSRRRMLDFTLQAMQWDVRRISTRTTERSGVGPVSGHNGEMLGVLSGALGTFIKADDTEYAEKAAEAIDTELRREAHEFQHVLAQPGEEIELLRLAMSLTHNCGDLDQGISFWTRNPIYDVQRTRFGRLAHENTTPYEGTFQIAAKLYKNMLSSEGHRHYPLRDVRALRSRPDFLLPLGPLFDEWGELLAKHPALTLDDRAEILAALLQGCRKIKGQVGYFRAVSGLLRGLGGARNSVIQRMPASMRKEVDVPEVKRHAVLARASFESSLRKRAQALLGR